MPKPRIGKVPKKVLRKVWKRLKGKYPEAKNFRKLLKRKQSSAKISKISRNTFKSRKSDIFYLLGNLLKYLLRTFYLPRNFQKFLSSGFLDFRSHGKISNKGSIGNSQRISNILPLPLLLKRSVKVISSIFWDSSSEISLGGPS